MFVDDLITVYGYGIIARIFITHCAQSYNIIFNSRDIVL